LCDSEPKTALPPGKLAITRPKLPREAAFALSGRCVCRAEKIKMRSPGSSSSQPTPGPSSTARNFPGNPLFIQGIEHAQDALAASAAVKSSARGNFGPHREDHPGYLAQSLVGGRDYVRVHPVKSAAFGLLVVYLVNRILRAR
jgi:hypothetical protein